MTRMQRCVVQLFDRGTPIDHIAARLRITADSVRARMRRAGRPASFNRRPKTIPLHANHIAA